MKKLFIVLVAASFGLSSCSKEVKLENTLDGKWNLDSYTKVVTSDIKFVATDTSFTDSARQESSVDPLITETITGDVDFVSNSNLVMHHLITETETEILENGSKTYTTTNDEDEFVYEYFVSAEDEITLINDGEYKVYNVTTNEKDAQTWEYKKVENNTNQAYDDFMNVIGYEESVTTTNITISLTLIK